MIIVKVMAGLGNQMFQYALYKNFIVQNKEAKLDISFFDYFNAHNGYELDRIFNISPIYATIEESNILGDTRLDVVSRILRKLGVTKKTHYTQDIVYGFGFEEKLLDIKENVYLQGYWQSEKYFYNAKDILRSEFSFKKKLDQKNQEISDLIKNTNSISLHVRRGDYVSSNNLGNVCSLKYYRNAMEYIKSEVDNPFFFVFSDDIDWCKANLNRDNIFYVNINFGQDSYKDMQLMSLCQHNIIANSSFSWWGAWLNINTNKIVVAPNKWFNNDKTVVKDIIPDDWIKIHV